MNIQFFSHWFKTALLLAVVFHSFSLSVKAQSDDSGTITGKVVDAESGEPIIGANISITGSTKGAATDLDGVYRIGEVQPGSQSVTVSYISYTKKNITDIQVQPGEVTQLNVSLQPETIGLGEVTVTAQASTDSEAGLLSIQRKAVPMQDGLSSEYLGKTGDGNVASAMKRVTGVTLLNGKDVFVRGLSVQQCTVKWSSGSFNESH